MGGPDMAPHTPQTLGPPRHSRGVPRHPGAHKEETVMARYALTLALLLVMAFSAGAQAPPIKIGFASAMSGPAAITGEGVRWGATLAVEEINAKGGVMGASSKRSSPTTRRSPAKQ